MLSVLMLCHYVEYRYAECRGAVIKIVNYNRKTYIE
jgi:hypothetical protein